MPLPVKHLLLGLALFTTACGGPWQVVRQSGPPSALASVESFGLEVDYGECMVGNATHEQYMAGLSPEEAAKKQEVWTTLNDAYGAGVSARTATSENPDATIVLVPTAFQFGKYAFMFKQPTVIHARIDWRVGGQVVDSIETSVKIDASMRRASILQRTKLAATMLGERAALYTNRAREQK